MIRYVPGRPLFTVLVLLLATISPALRGEGLYFEKRDFSAFTAPSVSDIAEDGRGYLWVGTPGGLIRYDGRKIKLINGQKYPELPADHILSVQFASDTGELWIGTPAGLASYNLIEDLIRPVKFSNIGDADTNIEVVDIATGNEEVFALTSNGIYRLGPGDSMELVPVDPGFENTFVEISDIAFGEDGGYWAAASDGLKQWDAEKQRFLHIRSLDDLLCLSVIGDEIWLGSAENKILRYTPETGTTVQYSAGEETSTIIEGPDKLIWAGSSDNGLALINPESGTTEFIEIDPEHPYKLPSIRIKSLMLGSSGHVWIGTADSGLYSVDIRKKNQLTYIQRSGSNGLPAGSIREIVEDSLGYLWTGSDIGGLARLDPYTGEIHQYVHSRNDFFSISGDRITGIVEDSSGRLWIGTDQGPAFYLPEVDGFEPVGLMMSGWPDFRGRHVLALVEGHDGSIWMSFRNGELYRLDPQERDYSVFSFPPSSVPTVLMMDGRGILWAGSRKNLRLFDQSGSLIKTWLPTGIDSGGFQEGGINSLFSDSRGRVWLGSPTGISYYSGSDERFSVLALPEDHSMNVSGISEDREGNLWISDGRHVMIYNSAGEFLTVMGEDVGLTPSGLITEMAVGRTGTMYVGSYGEIWQYESYLNAPAFDKPRVYLTELKIMNETRAAGRALDTISVQNLRSDEKVFSLGFGAVDFRYQGNVSYQYRLEGLNEDWVGTDDTDSVTFANLPPDDYVFIVRAINELGYPSENVATVGIHVERSFWRTPVAFVIYILLALGVISFAVKIWEGNLMKNQIRELEDARMKIIEANKKLSYLTIRDTLTGLLNRRGFDQGISHALSTARRNGQLITLFMMDVDYFKLYNDSYGHLQGDEVLRKVGKVLHSVFERSTDIIARYGGEEFSVVFVGENPNASVTLANDLISAIEKMDIKHEKSSVSSLLTLSTGSVTTEAISGETVENLIERADKALYAAKSGGRKRICYTGLIPELPVTMRNGTGPLVIDEVSRS